MVVMRNLFVAFDFMKVTNHTYKFCITHCSHVNNHRPKSDDGAKWGHVWI